MTKIPQIFASLEGSWNLKRFIVNEGAVVGRAVFKRVNQDPLTLLYREDGIFTSESSQSEWNVFREFLYRLEEDKISAYFHEKPPRLFHTLVFDKDDAKACHLCGCDQYDAFYQFKSPREFTLDYLIKGPKKDLKIHTIFTKTIEKE